jgi:hypothetical protein
MRNIACIHDECFFSMEMSKIGTCNSDRHTRDPCIA